MLLICIRFVAQQRFIAQRSRQFLFELTLFIKLDVGLGSAMTGVNVENFALPVSDDLLLDRILFLLLRISALLSVIQARAAHRRFKTIDNQAVYLLWTPLRFGKESPPAPPQKAKRGFDLPCVETVEVLKLVEFCL